MDNFLEHRCDFKATSLHFFAENNLNFTNIFLGFIPLPLQKVENVIVLGAKATGSVVQPPSGSPVTRPTTQNTASVSTTAQNTDSVSTTAPQRQPSTSATPTSSSPISTNRTIVFINRLTRPGEDVFLRGGLLFEIT